MPDQKRDGGRDQFPRLTVDHPETELTEDPRFNAHLLRHDLRDRMNLVKLTAAEIRRTKHPPHDLLDEWAATLERQVDAMLALIVVVREVPKPSDPPGQAG
jgi:hypothetical protein